MVDSFVDIEDAAGSIPARCTKYWRSYSEEYNSLLKNEQGFDSSTPDHNMNNTSFEETFARGSAGEDLVYDVAKIRR